MIKVAMIGAGSVVFSKNLTGDILAYPEFRDATFSYMDIDPDRLEVGANLCRKVADALGARPTIEATLDRREALKDADFVINMVQIGGFDSTLVDFEIPRKYGLNFTIADTTGPAGLFRALRTYPMLRGLCRDMEERCPNATLLNYTNPMSMNMQSVFRTSGIRAVGLCHSVQGTFRAIMRYIDEDPDGVAFLCAGINHMAFFLKLEKNGVDLYPRLFEAAKNPETFAKNKVRFEIMKRLGYFITESSEHNAEYCPWFIPHGREMIDRYDIPIDEYLRRCDGIVDEFERMKAFGKSDKPIQVGKSAEYGSIIIHAMATGTPRVVYGNMPNNGAIANLPDTAIIEAPTLVDRNGPQFTTVGALPPELIAYMQPHVSQHELFIRAATEGRRDHVYQAAMFDPLTAATLPIDRIVEMCDEMIAAQPDLIPDLDAKKTRVAGSGKAFGPVDPKALRASWDAAQAQREQDYITQWQVIGPFKSEKTGEITVEQATPLEEAFGNRRDGSVDLAASYKADGRTIKWEPASARKNKRGLVNLSTALGHAEWCAGYAYAEIEETHARDAVLRCGSEDGIKIWLNGEPVHANDAKRTFTPKADEAPIRLKEGINRLLVKVTNHTGGWSFSVSLPRANF